MSNTKVKKSKLSYRERLKLEDLRTYNRISLEVRNNEIKAKRHQIGKVSSLGFLFPTESSADVGATVVISDSSPFLSIPKADKEMSAFQEFQQGKATLKLLLETNEPILFDFVATTKKYKSVENNTTVNEAVVNALLTPRVRKSQKFTNRPLLLFDSSSKFSIACADIDYLPEWCKSFDELREELRAIFKDDAVVTSSNENKAKVWFFLNSTTTKDEKLNFLESKFSGILANIWNAKVSIENKQGKTVSKYIIDRKGIYKSFLSIDMLEELHNKVKTVKIHHFTKQTNTEPVNQSNTLPSKSYKIVAITTKTKIDKWNLFKGEVPQIILDCNKYVQYVFNVLAGSLVYSSGKGFNFPIKYFAELSKFSKRDIGNALKILCEMGVIEKNANYKVGHHANSYRFFGFYLQWAKNELLKVKTGKGGKSLNYILNSFEDGNWNEATFDLAKFAIRHHWSQETYLKTVKDISGWNAKPERIKQATGAFNSYSKWISKIISLKEKVA